MTASSLSLADKAKASAGGFSQLSLSDLAYTATGGGGGGGTGLTYGENVIGLRPAAGNAGAVYFATDVNGGTLYIDNGVAWTTVARGLTEALLKSLGTTKGDLIGFTAAATPARVGVGADGLPLIGDAASAAGFKFGAMPESSVTNLVTDLSTLSTAVAARAPSTRLVSAGTGLTGGGDLSADRTISMPAVGPGAIGPIGDTTHTPVITIDAQGRITALTSAVISGGGGGSTNPQPLWSLGLK